MQSFHVHFMYNFLMDYYHNEIIVEKQKSNLKKLLKENQVLTREIVTTDSQLLDYLLVFAV